MKKRIKLELRRERVRVIDLREAAGGFENPVVVTRLGICTPGSRTATTQDTSV